MFRHSLAAVSVVVLAALAVAMPARASGSAHDAVRSAKTDKVVNSFGSCVRTKWDAAEDICAPAVPKPEPVTKLIPAPPPEISREQRSIYFEYKKSEISPKGKEKLDTLAALIRSSGAIKQARVVGYTDVIGGDNYNIKLSERRAGAVNKYLASRITVPTEVLTVKGLGESSPITDCSEKMSRKKRIDCLAKDRRVEVELVYEK